MPEPPPPPPIPLSPRTEGQLRGLLDDPRALPSWVAALGSPLNVVLPERLPTTLAGFRAVLDERRLTGEVFYAHKANRSSALVRRLADTRSRIDVASLGELQHALGAGFTPDRIAATGPKTPAFCWLAARTGIAVHVDSAAELITLADLVRTHRLPRIRVLLRLSGFASTGVRTLSRPSRFGIPVAEIDALLDVVQQHQDAIELIGVGYHLDTVALPEKVAAFDTCLTVLARSSRHGLTPSIVDLGGGFGVNYLADGEQWQRWTSELAQAVLGQRPPLTWGGYGYGLRAEGGRLRGVLGLYPAYRPLSGPDYLAALLDSPAPSFADRPLGEVLQEHLFDLWIEPGRALLDQAGLVLARVLETRATPTGHPLVRLDLNAADVSLEEHGVQMDPVLIPAPGRDTDPITDPNTGPAGTGGVGVYLLGNLCLESDLITRRVVRLPRRPRPGDLLAFVNTAGYFMDFRADHALHQPIARTIAAWPEDGDWRWCLDDEFWPLHHHTVPIPQEPPA